MIKTLVDKFPRKQAWKVAFFVEPGESFAEAIERNIRGLGRNIEPASFLENVRWFAGTIVWEHFPGTYGFQVTLEGHFTVEGKSGAYITMDAKIEIDCVEPARPQNRWGL